MTIPIKKKELTFQKYILPHNRGCKGLSEALASYQTSKYIFFYVELFYYFRLNTFNLSLDIVEYVNNLQALTKLFDFSVYKYSS